MSIGFWQIAIVVILVVLLFGRGKISSLMGDVAEVINQEDFLLTLEAVDVKHVAEQAPSN